MTASTQKQRPSSTEDTASHRHGNGDDTPELRPRSVMASRTKPSPYTNMM